MHCSFFELSQAGKSTKPQGRTHIDLDSMLHAPKHTQGPKKKGRSTKKKKATLNGPENCATVKLYILYCNQISLTTMVALLVRIAVDMNNKTCCV
jgi:hypothetical protein